MDVITVISVMPNEPYELYELGLMRDMRMWGCPFYCIDFLPVRVCPCLV